MQNHPNEPRAAQREARNPENSFWIILKPKITTWLLTDWRQTGQNSSSDRMSGMKAIDLQGRLKQTSETSEALNDATGEEIQRLASPCPLCGKERLEHLDGHKYALVASEVARTHSEELTRFFQLYRRHEWAELNLIQRFNGGANAAEVFALLCGGRICMLAIRDPVDLYDSDSLLDSAILDEVESAIVRALPIRFKDV